MPFVYAVPQNEKVGFYQPVLNFVCDNSNQGKHSKHIDLRDLKKPIYIYIMHKTLQVMIKKENIAE